MTITSSKAKGLSYILLKTADLTIYDLYGIYMHMYTFIVGINRC